MWSLIVWISSIAICDLSFDYYFIFSVTFISHYHVSNINDFEIMKGKVGYFILYFHKEVYDVIISFGLNFLIRFIITLSSYVGPQSHRWGCKSYFNPCSEENYESQWCWWKQSAQDKWTWN